MGRPVVTGPGLLCHISKHLCLVVVQILHGGAKTGLLRVKNMPDILQGSVATHLRRGYIFIFTDDCIIVFQ